MKGGREYIWGKVIITVALFGCLIGGAYAAETDYFGSEFEITLESNEIVYFGTEFTIEESSPPPQSNEVIYFGTEFAITPTSPDNDPPTVSLSSPANGSTITTNSTVLAAIVVDPNGDSMTVTFYGRVKGEETWEVWGQNLNVGNGTTAETVYDLQYNTTYEWYVAVSDGEYYAYSDTWEFTVVSQQQINLQQLTLLTQSMI